MPVKKARKHSKTEAKYVVPAHVVKIVKKVQHHILEEPKRFDMGEWIRSARSISRQWFESDKEWKAEINSSYPACGTTACIAGWVAILSNPLKRDKNGYLLIPKLHTSISNFAAKKLGLSTKPTSLTTQSMFHAENWPEPFNTKFFDENNKVRPNRAKLAKIAVDRLEYFLETGQ